MATSWDVTTPSVRMNTETDPCEPPHHISTELLRLMLATEWIQDELEKNKKIINLIATFLGGSNVPK